MQKQIGINISNEFHILRHFSEVSEEYIQSILGQRYQFFDKGEGQINWYEIDEAAIEAALNTTGSKFLPNLPGLETPRKVLELAVTEYEKLIATGTDITWQPETNSKQFGFLIEYGSPVGYLNLVPLAELTTGEQARVEKIPRSSNAPEKSTYVKVLRAGGPKKEISTIEIGLYDYPEVDFLHVTAFPGVLLETPGFPNPRQTAEARKISEEYWDDHVFLEFN